MCRGLRGAWSHARCCGRISDCSKGREDSLSGRIPGMCEDDVVARVVLATATGSGGAGETEFEDHGGVFVGVVVI